MIGVDIVEQDIAVILQKDLGDLELYALFITLIGIRKKIKFIVIQINTYHSN